ncbi:hypothetical protein D3C72_2136210 [compost metagenome]
MALADGTAVGDGRILIRDTTKSMMYMPWITDGRIELYLPDGTYEVTAYMNDQTYEHTPLSYVITVINGVSSPAVLNIVI